MTFDELFKDHHLTDEEREKLIIHLAVFRALTTFKTLMKSARRGG